ncbi:MAG: DUF2948 family protein [Kiloniellales bacterium]|nr:DUF2948 family protein [Kiloniellales bacterium]
MIPPPSIKLRAHDRDDMEVVAAWLQDALAPVADMAYLKREKRFVMVVNRFKWEIDRVPGPAPVPPADTDARFEDDAEPPAFERVNCGICFDRVKKVRLRGFKLEDKDQILNLLTIHVEPKAITLVFSDDAMVRLEVSAIACHLEDLGEPWPTHWRPEHEEDQTPAG